MANTNSMNAHIVTIHPELHLVNFRIISSTNFLKITQLVKKLYNRNVKLFLKKFDLYNG